MIVVVLVVVEVVVVHSVSGYSDGSRLLTSSGSFRYHSGSKSPVGRGVSGPVGIAVLSTESTESCVGSMVLGSIARPNRVMISWLWSWALEARVPATRAGRMSNDFIFASGVDPRGSRLKMCGVATT